jgi:hypothetical protein
VSALRTIATVFVWQSWFEMAGSPSTTATVVCPDVGITDADIEACMFA